MDTAVVVAIVAAVSTLVSSIISAIVSNKMIEWRLKELEKKVESHNSYAQKFAETTKDIALIKQSINWMQKTMESKNG